MSDAVYVICKRLTVFIPFIASLYFICWFFIELPLELVGWLMIAMFFLEASLYFHEARADGVMVLEQVEDGKIFSLELSDDPSKLVNKDVVKFKVQDKSGENEDRK